MRSCNPSPAWTLVAPYDPNLPIRDRYVSPQLVVEPRPVRETKPGSVAQPLQPINLRVAGGWLLPEANPLQPDLRFFSFVFAVHRASRQKVSGARRTGGVLHS